MRDLSDAATKRILDDAVRLESVLGDVFASFRLIDSPDLAPLIKDKVIEALGMEMQRFYTGFEAAAERILKRDGVAIPSGGASHRALLNSFLEKYPIEAAHADLLDDLLGFRHIVRKDYGFPLREDETEDKGRLLMKHGRAILGAIEHYAVAPKPSLKLESLPPPPDYTPPTPVSRSKTDDF